MNWLKKLFAIEKSPGKGLMAVEIVVLAYMLLTLVIVLFTYTKLENPDEMVWGRLRIGFITLALWGVYRLLPCPLTRLVRILVQLVLLSWWYPDTYEINRLFPNLDHIFARAEQWLFGFQPAFVFHKAMPGAVFSELMDLGYAAYYPMIGAVILYYFFKRYAEFERASFVVLTSFFIFYVIFIAFPVTGPQYYFPAIGMDQVAEGIFPNVYDYFNTHNERMVSPGYADGIFYHMVESAHNAGERPTAAFPSSHVGITTIIMLLAWRSGSRKLFFILLPLFILMCFATVYILAHYAIDAIAGLFVGVAMYYGLMYATRHWKPLKYAGAR